MESLPRRPLTGIALLFTGGICLGLNLETPSALPLIAGALSLLTSLITNRIVKLRCLAVPALLLAIAASGWSHARLSLESQPPSLSQRLPVPASTVGMIGITEDNATLIHSSTNAATWKVPVDVQRIRLSDDRPWEDVAGPVWVRFRLPPHFHPPSYGERWAFSGYLEAGTNKTQPLRRSAAFLSAGRSAHRISKGHGNAFLRFAIRTRQSAQRILTHGISAFPQESAILNSLLLGVRGQMPRELYQSFANTSTLHVFAISGSHVVILAGVVVLALSAGGIPRTRWILVLAPVLLLYTVMTGLQSSATRACIMAVLFWSAPLLGRKPDIYASLGAAAILLLAWSPADLADAGFLLSFVAVMGIALFTPVFMAPIHRRLQRDPLQLLPDPTWKTFARRLGLEFGGLVAMTLAAALVSAPLTALYFGSVSPIGLLGNLLAVPLASLMILSGALSIALGSIGLLFASLFNHANVALAFALHQFISFLSSVPGGHWIIEPPPLWGILLCYAGIILIRFAIWINSSAAPAATTRR